MYVCLQILWNLKLAALSVMCKCQQKKKRVRSSRELTTPPLLLGNPEPSCTCRACCESLPSNKLHH